MLDVMPVKLRCFAPLACILSLACSPSGGASQDAADIPGDALPDSPRADGPLADVAPDAPADAADVAPDVSPFPLPPLDSPVPLSVGVAGAIMAVPLGVPICGFMPPNKPQSPYSDKFPGSSTAYLHPTVRVMALEGGQARLLFVRMDLIAVNSFLVQRISSDLTDRTGYDWSGKVIVGATHTHSSSGRMAPGFIWETLADSFFPELYERVVDQIVDLAVQAILSMQPGRMGYAAIETDKLHGDRRCENPEMRDDRLHVLRFDDADGSPLALVLVHSLHGTLIDVENQNLSRDVIGGIEEKVKESFDHPVEVLFFQAGTGDMSPTDPPVEPGNPLVDLPGDYTRIEAVGQAAAGVVQASINGIETSPDVAFSSLSHYVPLGREVMGYEDGEFPFECGGAYCGSTAESECWTGQPTPIPGLDQMCLDIAVSGDCAPDRTLLSAALLGDLLFVTFPGEPVTQVLLNVEDGIRKLFPDQDDIVVIGYSQDYVGYSTPEWDWWQGGYEASGAIWGPKQGDYLTGAAVQIAAHLLDDAQPPEFDDPGPFDLLKPDVAPFVPARSKDAGEVVTQPAAGVLVGESVAFEFTGGDPWHLLPRVTLEKDSGGGQFEPVLRNNGSTVDSLGYEFISTVTPAPAYDEVEGAAIRKFTWRVTFHTERRVPAPVFPLKGTYRFRAAGEFLASDTGDPGSYDVTSAPFVVE